MNAVDKQFWREIHMARIDNAQRATAKRIRDCRLPESETCEGACRECPYFVSVPFEPELPKPKYREFTSVCPVCGKGYQSWHGMNLTCRACREEPAAGAMWGWERGEE